MNCLRHTFSATTASALASGILQQSIRMIGEEMVDVDALGPIGQAFVPVSQALGKSLFAQVRNCVVRVFSIQLWMPSGWDLLDWLLSFTMNRPSVLR